MTFSPEMAERIAQSLATITLILAGYGLADIGVNLARAAIG